MDPSSSLSLEQSLKLIIHSRKECWVYAIFWQATKQIDGNFLLSWGGGHFQGTKQCPTPKELANNTHDLHIFGVKSSPIQPLFSDNCSDIDRLIDPEWFYMMSIANSYVVGAGILGRTFKSGAYTWLANEHELKLSDCERAREANLHGIQTLVCIPTACGVVELGSTEIIKEDLDLLLLAKSLFGHRCTTRLTKQPSEPGESATSTCRSYSGRSQFNGHLLSDSKVVLHSGKRGRNSNVRGETPTNHVEAEKQRRDKLNNLFYVLRGIVPNVSKMDRASLLADAVAYIKQLQKQTEELEAKLCAKSQEAKISFPSMEDNQSTSIPRFGQHSSSFLSGDGSGIMSAEVDVKVTGSEATIRVQSTDVNYPVARLMDAIRVLECHVHHASISKVKDLVVQLFVVQVPDALKNDAALRIAILRRFLI